MAHQRAVALAEERLAAHGPLKHELRRWPASEDRAGLIGAWDGNLASQGFRRMMTGLPQLPDYLAPGAWMAAWIRDREVVALVGQLPAADSAGFVPVTVLVSVG
ncbi:MAG: hypothetical protein ACK4TG_12040 [Thermaurantiacus sp.]